MYKSQIINRDLKYTMNVERKLKMVGGIWLDISAALKASNARRNDGRTETGIHWMIVLTRAEDSVML